MERAITMPWNRRSRWAGTRSAGVQGTLYGVRLALRGHSVTLVARGRRAAELQQQGAVIEHVLSGQREVMRLPVSEDLNPNLEADLCLITVRREQLMAVVPPLLAARGVARAVFMVNHACGSEMLFTALGRERTVLAFPGAAGGIEGGVDRFVEVSEQPTVVEAGATDVVKIFREAGFRVVAEQDVDSWLRRHAIFVTSMVGALYEVGVEPRRLSADRSRLGVFVRAVREGWAALDQLGVAPPSLALRAIFRWVPLGFAVGYWQRLLASPRGEYYFARHARHAAREMAALVMDVRALAPGTVMPNWERLSIAIDTAAAKVR
jgi:2-dehydropantoate 2-reductase